jgi:hypothetical protein
LSDTDGAASLTPPPPPVHIPSKAIPDLADLIWEDEPVGSQSWWLSRSRSGDLQLFLVADPLTSSLLCLTRSGARPNDYDMLLVMPDVDTLHQGNPVDLAKTAIARKIARPEQSIGRSVLVWRLQRIAKLAMNQLPLAVTSFATGAALGLAVALFAVSTAMVGWPMLAIGIVLGAASGPVLKFIIDRRIKSLLGPWGRFWVATSAAAAGAVIAAGGLLALFWS